MANKKNTLYWMWGYNDNGEIQRPWFAQQNINQGNIIPYVHIIFADEDSKLIDIYDIPNEHLTAFDYNVMSNQIALSFEDPTNYIFQQILTYAYSSTSSNKVNKRIAYYDFGYMNGNQKISAFQDKINDNLAGYSKYGRPITLTGFNRRMEPGITKWTLLSSPLTYCGDPLKWKPFTLDKNQKDKSPIQQFATWLQNILIDSKKDYEWDVLFDSSINISTDFEDASKNIGQVNLKIFFDNFIDRYFFSQNNGFVKVYYNNVVTDEGKIKIIIHLKDTIPPLDNVNQLLNGPPEVARNYLATMHLTWPSVNSGVESVDYTSNTDFAILFGMALRDSSYLKFSDALQQGKTMLNKDFAGSNLNDLDGRIELFDFKTMFGINKDTKGAEILRKKLAVNAIYLSQGLSLVSQGEPSFNSPEQLLQTFLNFKYNSAAYKNKVLAFDTLTNEKLKQKGKVTVDDIKYLRKVFPTLNRVSVETLTNMLSLGYFTENEIDYMSGLYQMIDVNHKISGGKYISIFQFRPTFYEYILKQRLVGQINTSGATGAVGGALAGIN